MANSMAEERLDVVREMTESIANHPNQTAQQQLKSKPKPISKKPTGANKARANVVGLEENIDVDVV